MMMTIKKKGEMLKVLNDELFKIVIYALKYNLGKAGNQTIKICEKLENNCRYFNQTQLEFLTFYLESVVPKLKNKFDKDCVIDTYKRLRNINTDNNTSLSDCYAFDRDAIMYWLVCPDSEDNFFDTIKNRLIKLDSEDKNRLLKDMAEFQAIIENIPFFRHTTVKRLCKLRSKLK